ncbi:MAG: hypothetical protein OXC62_13255 [Aestuariivita sp.]|nr:hypothetical protein [Aestuariivita sp.]
MMAALVRNQAGYRRQHDDSLWIKASRVGPFPSHYLPSSDGRTKHPAPSMGGDALENQRKGKPVPSNDISQQFPLNFLFNHFNC